MTCQAVMTHELMTRSTIHYSYAVIKKTEDLPLYDLILL